MTAVGKAAEPPGRRPAGAGTARCFVALWPDAAAAEALDALAARLHARHRGTRRMRRENLHLTLAFIGDLGHEERQRVANALSAPQPAPFDWAVDRVGAFGAARVLWAGSGTDERLAALAARVRAQLDALGVRYDRKPFVPHVTLLRDLPQSLAKEVEQTLEPPVTWPVQRAVLLQSTATAAGVRYREVAPG